jgi:hypothetical protein
MFIAEGSPLETVAPEERNILALLQSAGRKRPREL